MTNKIKRLHAMIKSLMEFYEKQDECYKQTFVLGSLDYCNAALCIMWDWYDRDISKQIPNRLKGLFKRIAYYYGLVTLIRLDYLKDTGKEWGSIWYGFLVSAGHCGYLDWTDYIEEFGIVQGMCDAHGILPLLRNMSLADYNNFEIKVAKV